MKTWLLTNEIGQQIKVRVESILDLPEEFGVDVGVLADVVKAERIDELPDDLKNDDGDWVTI